MGMPRSPPEALVSVGSGVLVLRDLFTTWVPECDSGVSRSRCWIRSTLSDLRPETIYRLRVGRCVLKKYETPRFAAVAKKP